MTNSEHARWSVVPSSYGDGTVDWTAKVGDKTRLFTSKDAALSWVAARLMERLFDLENQLIQLQARGCVISGGDRHDK